MPGVVTRFEIGPITFPVGVVVTGGQLLQPGSGATAGQLIIGTDGSLTIFGVAKTDAAPEPAVATTPSQNLDIHIPRGHVAVAHIGSFDLTATGAIAFGDYVGAAANGTVKTIAAAGAAFVQAEINNNTRGIIGRCIATAGIANGVRGLIRLSIR